MMVYIIHIRMQWLRHLKKINEAKYTLSYVDWIFYCIIDLQLRRSRSSNWQTLVWFRITGQSSYFPRPRKIWTRTKCSFVAEAPKAGWCRRLQVQSWLSESSNHDNKSQFDCHWWVFLFLMIVQSQWLNLFSLLYTRLDSMWHHELKSVYKQDFLV